VQAEKKGNVFVARLDRESHASEGEPIELAVDTNRLHFFEIATGDGIYADRGDPSNE
jgi:hypothetical protein